MVGAPAPESTGTPPNVVVVTPSKPSSAASGGRARVVKVRLPSPVAAFPAKSAIAAGHDAVLGGIAQHLCRLLEQGRRSSLPSRRWTARSSPRSRRATQMVAPGGRGSDDTTVNDANGSVTSPDMRQPRGFGVRHAGQRPSSPGRLEPTSPLTTSTWPRPVPVRLPRRVDREPGNRCTSPTSRRSWWATRTGAARRTRSVPPASGSSG